MDDRRRQSLMDTLLSLIVVGVSLYPLYRDDLARLRLRAEQWMRRGDQDKDALAQVQREISLMEHGQ